MRWTRVNPHKEESTKEPGNYMQVYNPPPKKGFFNKIKEKILKIVNNFNKPKKSNQKANFYQIETKKVPKDSFSRTTSILAIAIIIAVIALVIGTIAMIVINVKKEKEEEQYRAQVEEEYRKQEEEKARIAAEKEAERQAKLPKLTEEGIANMENIYFADSRRVFLTFDDGPSSNTEPILDILKQENIKATFFELGSRVEAQPASVKRAYDEGHYIASHGYSHVYSQIYSSTQAVLDEYNQSIQSIRNAIGESEYDPHLFRFPGGLPGGPYADLKAQAKQLLLDNHILNIDWNALSGDAEGNDLPVERLMARLDETVGAKNNVVLLMHDSQAKTTTVEALPQIIAYFRDRGYEFVNFYDVIK